MPTHQQRSLADIITKGSPELLKSFPVETFIAHLDRIDPYAKYHELSDEVLRFAADLSEQLGPDLLETYHKLLLLTLIKGFDRRAERAGFPESTRAIWHEAFTRILSQIEANAPSYLLDNDLFLKDLGVCRMKLIPCGVGMLEVLSGVPRRYLLNEGPLQAGATLLWVARRLGGVKPIYELHLDRHALKDFTWAGWERCYLRAAQVLEAKSEIRGIGGGTWWLDPQLETISPELRYLRQCPEQNGARFFRVGPDDSGLALRFSKIRKKLYREGRYQPTNYFMVWPRADLITWARGLLAGRDG